MEESEPQLQEYFINMLRNNGYEYVEINNEDDLIANFEKQLKSFNNFDFDFPDVLNYLSSGDRNTKFDKLRSSYNGVEFIDFSNFSSNIFQVAEEITVEGDYINRYDVTILINGLPLVQIELKKSGVNISTAFGQIQRYSKHSYSGLFDFIQIFVISNKVNTKYFFNDSNFNYNLTYNWFDNKDLESFTNTFLVKNNLMLILSGYIFKDLISNDYIMLRQYQIDALTCVLEKIKNNENGYLWIAPNTGKTTIALRLAQILSPSKKVIYIIKDNFTGLPISKTKKEFLADFSLKNLIFTNINIILALTDDELDFIRDEENIFIFDDYEKQSSRYNPSNLIRKFDNSLFYCFTQTPIFDENIIGDRTTKSIFDSQIYSYSFIDALRDKTSLPINVEYVGDVEISNDYDLSSDIRINRISNYIVDNFNQKSILILASNKDLIRYCEILKKSDLKVVPILRHDANEIFESTPMRDYFEKYIIDYNDEFNANIAHKKVVGTEKISHEFEADVIKRFKNGEIDLVLVDAGMFFDEYKSNILGNLKDPKLNNIYLDCELEYGELFEVLSMVNVPDEGKDYGSAVLFRDLRQNIDDAMELFLNNSASEETTFKDYDYYLDKYDNSFDDFKSLSYYYDILTTFDEFDFDKARIDEFNRFKDEFEHEQFELNSNKKIITDFNLALIDQFTIDLDYQIQDDVSGQQASETTINIDNSSEFHKTDVFNVDNIDNSSEFNETNILSVNNIDNSNKSLNAVSLNKIDNSRELNVINQDLSKTINVTNEYHIHLGGDTIQSEINFDFDDLIESRIVEDDESMKFCIECQAELPGDFNICPNHEEETLDLVYVDELIKSCKACGRKYPKDFKYCPYCDCEEPLTIKVKEIETLPNRFYDLNNHTNNFTEISQLLSSENRNNLYAFNFTQMQFDIILGNIINTHNAILDYLVEEYAIDISSLSTVDKILLFSKAFIRTDYKEGGGDLGYYQYNEIHIDDRLPDALQITTIIHEISHFLLAEILEQIVCEVLDTNKTDAVEAFVCYVLANNVLNSLVDEYCAHTVEGRYAPFGYQDYGSYKKCLDKFLQVFSDDAVEPAKRIGNTFAHYIKSIMETFIDEDLREDIKEEFSRINDVPNYSELKFEISGFFEWDKFQTSIKLMLTSDFEELTDNSENMDKLEVYAVKFKKNNQR